jgi:hypothetical protein
VGQRDHLNRGVTGADDQIGAALVQLAPEISQGLGQETGPVRRRVDRGIVDEEGHHLPGAGARLVQRRVVVQPQITCEDDDRGFQCASPMTIDAPCSGG